MEIKRFNDILLDGEPKINDYVICKEQNAGFGVKIISEFTSNNIGKIINILKKVKLPYLVKYNIDFKKVDFKSGQFGLVSEDGECVRRMSREEIKFWSEDKEELEALLNQQKFNL